MARRLSTPDRLATTNRTIGASITDAPPSTKLTYVLQCPHQDAGGVAAIRQLGLAAIRRGAVRPMTKRNQRLVQEGRLRA
jgi:hypothetical protein